MREVRFAGYWLRKDDYWAEDASKRPVRVEGEPIVVVVPTDEERVGLIRSYSLSASTKVG